MTRLVLCVLALLAVGGLADPGRRNLPQRTADPAFLQRQVDLMSLYFHIHEPTFIPEQKTVASSWDIEKNIEHYSNVTAVKIYVDLYEQGYLLPRAIPFTILNDVHRFEAVTFFNVLYSAKDYTTFYNTAAYLRGIVNEGVFVYVLTAAILHRPDTQGIVVPPIYEIFPSFFHNGEIMTTAQRINTHGKRWIHEFPSTFVWNDDIVIRCNDSVWSYFIQDAPIWYYTHDTDINAYYYNEHLSYPFWLGGETCPLVKDKRGERLWFIHKQLLTRYYMERLSNGLGEIPELGLDVVPQGYTPALTYHNGVPFPYRPQHYHLDQPHLVEKLTRITDFEHRIREVIDCGYFVNSVGEHISIRTTEGLDILGRLIEANVDSPNVNYYGDFISLWKIVLGNAYVHDQVKYHNKHVPLVVPSILDHYQTALRDPAFYMIWKRVLRLFTLWQEQLPPYKPEELGLPSVAIQNVEVDKLVTYFEYSHTNLSNHLYMTEQESQQAQDHVSVLAQHPQLNHKVFQVRVHVKSDVAKTVFVRFFLAPKYDSLGYEIPLHLNTENFFLLEQFTYDLPQGETVIKRDSTQNVHVIDGWSSYYQIYLRAQDAIHGKSQFVLDQSERFNSFPQRYILPKGRVGGMPFVFLVHISEYRAPKVEYGTGFDPAISIGFGSGATSETEQVYGYPLDRPLYQWQIQNLHNFMLKDVIITHRVTPEIQVPFTE